MKSDLWIGLSASVPLAIGANLVTPWIRRWLDKHLAIRTLKQAKRIGEDYLKVAAFHHNPGLLSEYLLETILKMLVLGVLAILLSVFCSILVLYSWHFSIFATIAISVLSGIGLLVLLLCMQVLTTYSRDALTLAYNVHHIEQYTKEVPADIREKLESAIDTLRRPKS